MDTLYRLIIPVMFHIKSKLSTFVRTTYAISAKKNLTSAIYSEERY